MQGKYKAMMAVAVATGAAALYVMWPLPEIAAAPAGQAAAGADADLKHGARVVALGDCMVCHTAAGGAAYAGGLPLRTPFGTIYSTNITPDPDTGIGRWTYQAFERAMRHGVSRDGHLLYPAFPYVHYTQMTDGDIRAAYGYLMSRTPVNAAPPANDLVFPLGFRPLLAGWNLLFLRPGNRIAPDSQGGAVARGQYLVDSLGHCASCHSGLNVLGGENSQAFGGGHIDGWDAPSLLRLKTLPVPWTQADLFDYLYSGLSRAHGAAKGPMQPVVAHLSEVPADDVYAMVAYLNHIQQDGSLDAGLSGTHASRGAAAGAAPVPPSNAMSAMAMTTAMATAATPGSAAPVDAALRKQGATLFAAACASCHGGSAPMVRVSGSPALALSRSTTDASPNNFLQTVLGGVARTRGPTPLFMPAYADTLTDAQVTAIAAYVRGDLAARPAWPQRDIRQALSTIRNGGEK